MGWGALWKRGRGRRSSGELGRGCFGRLMKKWVRARVHSGSQTLGCPWVAEGLHGSVWELGSAQLCPTDLGEVGGGRLDQALGV